MEGLELVIVKLAKTLMTLSITDAVLATIFNIGIKTNLMCLLKIFPSIEVNSERHRVKDAVFNPKPAIGK